MFEFLFKYPAAVFAKGHFILLGGWPRWVLLAAAMALTAALAALMWRRRVKLAKRIKVTRALVLWGLQSALLILLLLLLWEPAISVTSLKPQENIVVVLIDDSRSMSLRDSGSQTRLQQATALLQKQLVPALSKHFQVRLYRLGAGIDRIAGTDQLSGSRPATLIGKGLRQIAGEAATLPVGAVVLLSDGSDNSGGVDAETISELRRRRLPVSTIGFGRTRLADDVEMESLDIPDKVLAGSRLQGQVTIHQAGFAGRHTKLTITGNGRVLATQDVVLTDTPEQIANVEFTPTGEGVQSVKAELIPVSGEENVRNNELTRVLSIDSSKRRILYVEGEPRWDYKFLRRAMDDDPVIQIVSMLRTTQNKVYRQGIANQRELEDGFPSKAEDLLSYQGLILGSVEAAYFTPAQQTAIQNFVDRRGGGLLFLGGRSALSDGGYSAAPFSELLPVILPARKNSSQRTTFQRTMVAAELTDAGKKSLICRIEDDPVKSNDHWDVLPYLANYQDAGTPKPGAVVLARVDVAGNRLPLLITENYGRGRTAALATGGIWRWRMQQPLGDNSEETFWRQLLRWQVSATPTRVVASTPEPNLNDDGKIELRAEVRDSNYYPASDASVQANIVGPDGASSQLSLQPEPMRQGVYSAQWDAARPGAYAAEITSGSASDVLTFQRQNGVAENFHAEQNEQLLRKLAEDTGSAYYTPAHAGRLPAEIAYSEAGITMREAKDLWDMPIVFLAILALRSSEWLLRRRWGVV